MINKNLKKKIGDERAKIGNSDADFRSATLTQNLKKGVKNPSDFSLPKDWQEVTLGEIIQFVNDKIEIEKINLENYISTENLLPDRLGVQKATTLPNIPKVNRFKQKDTLFSNIRTYFKKVWIANFDGGSSNDVLIFRPIDEEILNKQFLYYLISSDKFINFTVISAKGTKMPRGDKHAIKTFKINLPPLPQQKQIAKVLSSFDDKIEFLREQNQTLETLGQEIFKEWFGKYKVGDTLPDGWRVRKVGEIAKLKSGFAFKSNDFIENNNKKALKIKDLKGNGKVDVTNVSSISDEITKSERVQYFKLEAGNIVLAMSGNTTGKIGIFPENEKEIFLNQRVGKFFMEDKKLNSFLYFFLMSGNYEEIILNMGYGSAQPNISPSQIENIDVIISDEIILNKFLNVSDNLFRKVLKNNSQIQILSKIRDTLLPKLMKGEVGVKNIINKIN